MRATTGLNSTNALSWQGTMFHQKLAIFLGEDVIGHLRKRQQGLRSVHVYGTVNVS